MNPDPMSGTEWFINYMLLAGAIASLAHGIDLCLRSPDCGGRLAGYIGVGVFGATIITTVLRMIARYYAA